jgi:sugar/nucleoside kinase (ribokinase family)
MEPAPWDPPPELLRRVDLLVLSVEDVAGDEAVAARYARHCPVVALTRGAGGLTLFVGGSPRAIPAYPARAVDANGAGDIFTAAMLVRLAETGDPVAAARFAAVVAALAVEGPGSTRIPDRDAVERALGGPLA